METETPDAIETEDIEWILNELDQVRCERDEAIEDRDRTQSLYNSCLLKLAQAENKIQDTRKRHREEMKEQNKFISGRAIALSNLVDEYASIVDRYVQLTGTKLTTNRLKQLQKYGGYNV